MLDVVQTNWHWYLLLEYIDGLSILDIILSRGRFKEKEARKISRQIASALDYCHKNNIVHRDVRIENIMLTKAGDVKIFDFLLSSLYSPHSQLKTFCGSLYFTAPELLMGKPYDGPKADIWSFGIVLYILVCRKVPFDDMSIPALHKKIKSEAVEFPLWLTRGSLFATLLLDKLMKTDCQSLISLILVKSPHQRASLDRLMMHDWMKEGYSDPIDSHLPHREPLCLPLDQEVIQQMSFSGFKFGTPAEVKTRLEKIIQSEEYQARYRSHSDENSATVCKQRHGKRSPSPYRGRRSGDHSSLPELALETARPKHGSSAIVSIYYLVREKMERDRSKVLDGLP